MRLQELGQWSSRNGNGNGNGEELGNEVMLDEPHTQGRIRNKDANMRVEIVPDAYDGDETAQRHGKRICEM